jgi:hypothetical protein
MGAGAHMWIQDHTDKQIKTYVHGVVCMYENGEQGSQLQQFNNLLVQPNSTWPDGQGLYIEAVGSGSCALSASTFTLKVVYLDSQHQEQPIADLSFQESSGTYYDSSTDPGAVTANINNQSDPAMITVDVTGI